MSESQTEKNKVIKKDVEYTPERKNQESFSLLTEIQAGYEVVTEIITFDENWRSELNLLHEYLQLALLFRHFVRSSYSFIAEKTEGKSLADLFEDTQTYKQAFEAQLLRLNSEYSNRFSSKVMRSKSENWNLAQYFSDPDRRGGFVVSLHEFLANIMPIHTSLQTIFQCDKEMTLAEEDIAELKEELNEGPTDPEYLQGHISRNEEDWHVANAFAAAQPKNISHSKLAGSRELWKMLYHLENGYSTGNYDLGQIYKMLGNFLSVELKHHVALDNLECSISEPQPNQFIEFLQLERIQVNFSEDLFIKWFTNVLTNAVKAHKARVNEYPSLLEKYSDLPKHPSWMEKPKVKVKFYIEYEGEDQQPYLVISVRDNGAGISRKKTFNTTMQTFTTDMRTVGSVYGTKGGNSSGVDGTGTVMDELAVQVSRLFDATMELRPVVDDGGQPMYGAESILKIPLRRISGHRATH